MKQWIMLVLVVVASRVSLAVEKETGKPSLQLTVDLTDGSRLIGTTTLSSLPVRSEVLGKIEVSLHKLRSAEFSKDHELVSLRLENGDELKVAITLAQIRLETLFGAVEVGTGQIRKFHVTLRGKTLPASVKEGLVLEYLFDHDEGGKATDASGNGNDGTVHDAQWVEDGHRQRSLKLDGEGDHVVAPNSASLQIKSAVTVCVWVKLKSFGPGGYGNEIGMIASKGNSLWWNPAFCLGYSKESGSPYPRWPGKPGPFPALFHVCNASDPQNGGGKTATTETKLETNKWYHLAGTYDGKTVSIYLDGQLESHAPYSGPLRADGAPVLLGGSNLGGTGWGNHFTSDATIDHVMIFNRALTETEVQQVYDSQR